MVRHPFLAAAEHQSFILISSRNAHVSRYPVRGLCSEGKAMSGASSGMWRERAASLLAVAPHKRPEARGGPGGAGVRVHDGLVALHSWPPPAHRF